MRKRTRHILAVLAVSTALCADQAVIAAPARPAGTVEWTQLAGRLVDRLSRSFRRVTLATWPTDMPRRWPERRATPQPASAVAVIPAHRPIFSLPVSTPSSAGVID